MIQSKTIRSASALGAIAIAVGVGLACNHGKGDCPAKEAITAGGACSDDELQCPYDLATASPACDGTSTTIATSCTCTNGTWACPDAVECEAGAPDASDDGATTDAGTDDGSADDGASG